MSGQAVGNMHLEWRLKGDTIVFLSGCSVNKDVDHHSKATSTTDTELQMMGADRIKLNQK